MPDQAREAHLAEVYRGLNPVRLRAEIEAALEKLWRLADSPTRQGCGVGPKGGL